MFEDVGVLNHDVNARCSFLAHGGQALHFLWQGLLGLGHGFLANFIVFVHQARVLGLQSSCGSSVHVWEVVAQDGSAGDVQPDGSVI